MKIVKTGYIAYNPQTEEVLQRGQWHAVKLADLKKVNCYATKKSVENRIAQYEHDLECVIKHCDKMIKETGDTPDRAGNTFTSYKLIYEAQLAEAQNFEIREFSSTTEIK